MDDLPPSAESLVAIADRLIHLAFPELGPTDLLAESAVVPYLVALARRQCAAGDAGMCRLVRSWLWDGVVAMLEEAELELGIDGRDFPRRFTRFVGGEDEAVAPAALAPGKIVPFRSRVQKGS